jgi:hemerythrin-like domain-containing protein
MPREERDAMQMLERSHHQLDQRLATLRDAARGLARGGAEADIDAVHDVLRFLERGAVRHVDDEELSLFPRLARHERMSGLIDTLHAQHLRQEQLHAELCELAPALAVPCPPEVAEALVSVSERLSAEYSEHIRLEDRELLPATRELLDERDLHEMLLEMQGRRGR